MTEDVFIPRSDQERDIEVRRIINEAKESQATSLDLGGLGLTDIPMEIEELPWLTQLYLGAHKSVREKPYYPYIIIDETLCNSVRNVPVALLNKLPLLTHLDLDFNKIGAVGARAIAHSRAKLTTLNLNNNIIKDDGTKAIARSQTQLITLNLGGNSIGDDGARAIAQSLTRLTTLNLGGNSIWSDGARAIAQSLKQLTTLILDRNNIGSVGARAIAQSLKQLTTLDLGSCRIGDDGTRAIARSLTQLSKLDLGGCGIGDTGARAIAKGLTKLTTLDLGINRIGDDGTKALAQSLNNLTTLNLGGNIIGDDGARTIAKHLTKLSTLVLGGNSIGDDGARAIASSGMSLTTLNLRSNSVGDDGAKAIAQSLTELSWLGLAGNKISIVPKEILSSPDAQKIIAAIHDAMESGPQRELNEAKLIVVGQEAVGKTSLIRFMIEGKPRRESQEQTIGADIHHEIRTHEWLVSDSPDQGSVQLNIWDFGGQEIMHGTHQFFLTERSLYMLVLDGRKKNDTSVYKWLRTIRNRGRNSPVLIVINKAVGENASQKLELDRVGLDRQHGNIVGIIETSCNDNEESRKSIEQLKQQIAKTLYDNEHLKHIFDTMPEANLHVKDDVKLVASKEKILKRDKFIDICDRRSVREVSQGYLLDLLHDLGVVIAYGREAMEAPYALQDIHLLDPNWLVQAIYKILIETQNLDSNGIFKRSHLCDWLDESDYPEIRHEFVLKMMMHESIGLCFELPHGEGYLLPEALSKQSHEFRDWNTNLRFRYRYEFLPRNLLPRFIWRAHDYLDPDDVRWIEGVVLTVSGCKVLVTAIREKRVVEVQVDGGNNPNRSRGALEVIRNLFLEVHKYNPETKATAYVPHPDTPENEEEFEDLLYLEQEEGSNFPIRKKGSKKTTVGELLDGVGRRTISEEKYARTQEVHVTNNFHGDVSGSQVGIHRDIIQDNRIYKDILPMEPKKGTLSFLTDWQKFAFLCGALMMIICAFSLSIFYSDLAFKWKLTLVGIPLLGGISAAIVVALNPKYFYRRILTGIIGIVTLSSMAGQIFINMTETYLGWEFLTLDWKVLILIGMMLTADVYLNRPEKSSNG